MIISPSVLHIRLVPDASISHTIFPDQSLIIIMRDLIDSGIYNLMVRGQNQFLWKIALVSSHFYNFLLHAYGYKLQYFNVNLYFSPSTPFIISWPSPFFPCNIGSGKISFLDYRIPIEHTVMVSWVHGTMLKDSPNRFLSLLSRSYVWEHTASRIWGSGVSGAGCCGS